MNNFLKEFAQDFLAFSVNIDKLEVGIRIGNPILAYAIDKLPEYKIKNTNYNRQTLKWFKYQGIDVERREIKWLFPISWGSYYI